MIRYDMLCDNKIKLPTSNCPTAVINICNLLRDVILACK